MDTHKIRIIQISDTHLFTDTDGRLMGVRTRDSLNAILQRIKRDYDDLDALLITGDLSQDGSSSSYKALKDALSGFNAPCYWVSGNHDEPELMHNVFPEAMVKRVSLGQWQVLLLDSRLAGSGEGYLNTSELDILEKHLHTNPDQHSVIAFHHQPASIDSGWMDKIGLQNPDHLKDIITKYQQVKCIIHGHVHQERSYLFAGVPVYATPSTCLQFEPHSEDFKASLSLPGFRVMDLYPDGTLDTSVIRLEDYALEVDLTANGY